MSVFTAIGTAIAATFFAGSAVAATVISVGLAVATNIGLSYLMKALAGKQPSNATDNFGIQFSLGAGGAVPRSFPLGKCATAGQLTYTNTWGGDQQTPNAMFVQVIKLSDLPRCKLLGLWVNGQKCTFNVGDADAAKFGPEQAAGYLVPDFIKPRADGEDAVPHLWIKYYDGMQTEADSYLVNTVSSEDRPYGWTRVGKGCAYVIVTALVNPKIWSGKPDYLWELSSIPLYDVTRDSTVGGEGGQRFSDPATWGGDGDDYPAVQVYNVLKGIYYEDAWVYGLQNMKAARLPPANWIGQIEKCRAPIEGEGPNKPTYISGGQISVDTQPMNAIKAYLSACQGRLPEIAGFFKIFLGRPDAPVATFTDDDIVSLEPQVFRPFFALSDSVNGVQARYPDPTQAWQYTTAPAYNRSDLEKRDGNRRLMATPQLDMVYDAPQVQRLQKSAVEEGQRARSHSLVMPPIFWIYEPGDVLQWTSARNGYVTKQFRIDGNTDKANLDVPLVLTEIDPSDYDWDPGTDFKPVTSGPTGIVYPKPQGVYDWTVEAFALVDANGIQRRPALHLTWDGTQPGIDALQFEVRLKRDQSAVTSSVTPPGTFPGGSLIFTQSMLPATDYQVRVQYVPTWPRDMLWSDWRNVTTPDVRFSLADLDAAIKAQVTAIHDSLQDQLDTALQEIAAMVAGASARGWLDKKEVRSDVSSRSDAAFAAIEEVQTVATDTQASLASYQQTVTARFGDVSAAISTNSEAIATLNGYAAAAWSVTLNVNNAISGIKLINAGSGTSAFIVSADKFQIQLPGYNGSAPVPVFTAGTLNGQPAIGISANLYLDGFVTARMMTVGKLSFITGDAGTLSAGLLTGPTGVMQIDLSGGSWTIWGN